MQGRLVLSALALLVLAACGGGGGGGGTPSVPITMPTATPAPAASPTVQFTIGQNQAVQIVRARHYVSPKTLSVVVVYSGTAYGVDFIQGSSGCSGSIPNLVCTVQFNVPPGSAQFTINAYDAYGGVGQLLSTAQVTVNVVAGVNKVSAVLDGVPKSASLPRAINVPEAVATSVPFAVTAYDADGAAIVGPGNYYDTVTLSDSDTGGGTSVTPTVTGPAAQPTVTYNGSSTVHNAYITASVVGFNTQGSATGLIRVVPQYAQYNTPSGHMARTIVPAPDGSLWLVEDETVAPNSPMSIAHVSASGSATEIPVNLPAAQGVESAVLGPDGALWCATNPMYGFPNSAIVRIDSSGNATTYTNAGLNFPTHIVLGPDNRLWFAQRSGIGAVDTSGNFSFYAYPTTPNGATARSDSIVAGPDGNLWSPDGTQGGLMRITPAGAITYFLLPSVPTGIAVQGSSLYVPSQYTVYQVGTSGSVQQTYTISDLAFGSGITPASNGSLWSPAGWDVAGGTVIARLTPSGAVSYISVPYPSDPGIGTPQITYMTSAADGSMWYVRGSTYGRIVVR